MARPPGVQRPAQVRRGLVLLQAGPRPRPRLAPRGRVHRRPSARRGCLRRPGTPPHHEGLPGRDHRGGQGVSASRRALGGDPRPLERAPRRPRPRPRTVPVPAGDERRRGRGGRPVRGEEGLRLHRSAAAGRHRHPRHGRSRRPRQLVRQQAGPPGGAQRGTGLHRGLRRPPRPDRRRRGGKDQGTRRPRRRRAPHPHPGTPALRPRRGRARPRRGPRPAGHRRRAHGDRRRARTRPQLPRRRRTGLPARLTGTRRRGEGRRGAAP